MRHSHSVFLRLQLPTTISVKFIGYGLPRVGNQAWANFVDARLSGDVTHINEDTAPIGPEMFLGYHRPSGEINIEESGDWVECPGQDNSDKLYIVVVVPTIFSGDINDHDGPYCRCWLR